MSHRTTAGERRGFAAQRARPGFHRRLLALAFCLQKEGREKGKEKKKSLFRVMMNFHKRWEQVQSSHLNSNVLAPISQHFLCVYFPPSPARLG